MLRRLLITLFAIVALSSTAMAQQPSSSAAKPFNGPYASLQWDELTWRIPKDFLVSTPPEMDELKLEVDWVKKTNALIPVDVGGYDQSLEIHIRKVNDEDPRNGLATIWRVGLEFSRLPQLASVHVDGLVYLGSSSGFHYFVMVDRDAYINCRPVEMSATVPADILSVPLVCETTFHLSHGLYAWVRTYGIKLTDSRASFVVIDGALRGFLN